MAKHKPTKLKFPLSAILRDKSTNARVSAIVELMSEADITEWELWKYGPNDKDSSWEWDGILQAACEGDGQIECYAVLAQDELHGLMSLDLAGHAAAEGHALVVDYLASNPANRNLAAGIKDVGTVLIALAVYRSRELGSEGRLWLESIPGSEIFYERCGFTRLPGISAEGNAMFFLSKAAADWHLQTVREAKQLSVPE